MNYQKNIKYTIHLICILLLVVPYAEVFTSISEEDMEWKSIYIYSDIELIIMFAPFYFAWIGLQFSKNKKVKSTLNIIALILSGFYLLLNSMPVQDFVPHNGILLLLTLLLLLNIVQKKASKNQNIKQ